MADKKRTKKLLLIVGNSALGAGLLLHIVGISTSAWMVKKDNSNTKLGEGTGIFTLCDQTWQCDHHDTEPGQLMAVQIMAGLGLIFAAVALTLALRHTMRSLRWGVPDPEVLVNMVLLTSLTSCVLILFATTIYAMEILHKWTVGPTALDQLKLGYSLKLSTAGAIMIFIGGFVSVGGANKIKTPTTNKAVLEEFSIAVMPQDRLVRNQRVASSERVGKDTKERKLSRKISQVAETTEQGTEDANGRIYFRDDNVRFVVSQRDFHNEYKQNDGFVPERKYTGSSHLETFWETNDEDLDVGDDAYALNTKMYLAQHENSSTTYSNRKRRCGVDESAKAAAVFMKQSAGTNEITRFNEVTNMATNHDACINEKPFMNASNMETVAEIPENVFDLERDQRQELYLESDKLSHESMSQVSDFRDGACSQKQPFQSDGFERKFTETPQFLSSNTQVVLSPTQYSTDTTIGSRSTVIITKL